MQTFACWKEHMTVHYVFRALCIVYPGSAVSWSRQVCNRQSMQRVQMLGHKCSFQSAIVLILVVRNDKRSSGIDGKTSDCPSRNCLYYRYVQIPFCQ